MNDNFQVDMNEYLPLRDVVFNTLRRAILKGELKPGERLMEIQLAQRLGVSRTPVREAIRKLELEGLVNMMPRRGAVVAEITLQDLEDVLEVRAVLEELAVQKACENITEDQLRDLKKAANDFKRSLEDDNLLACVETDMAFHEIIYSAANNRRLARCTGPFGAPGWTGCWTNTGIGAPIHRRNAPWPYSTVPCTAIRKMP